MRGREGFGRTGSIGRIVRPAIPSRVEKFGCVGGSEITVWPRNEEANVQQMVLLWESLEKERRKERNRLSRGVLSTGERSTRVHSPSGHAHVSGSL